MIASVTSGDDHRAGATLIIRAALVGIAMTTAHQHRAVNTVPPSPARLEVECAVYRQGRLYQAACLDLALVVERPSAEQAMDELVRLAASYVQDAQEAGLSGTAVLRPMSQRDRMHVHRKLAFAALRQCLIDTLRLAGLGGGRLPVERFERRYLPV